MSAQPLDLLGIVFDYIKQYAQVPGAVAAYTDDQIIRGQQNAAILPELTEFCVYTYLRGIRHGTTLEALPDENDAALVEEKVEHLVQVDLYSAEPYTPQESTRERAQALEMISRSGVGARFFESQGAGLSLLYAEDIGLRPGWDDTKNYTACFTTILHIEQNFSIKLTELSFTGLNVRSVPAHDAAGRTNQPGWLLTENVDTDHT